MATREHVDPPWAMSRARWADAYKASGRSLPKFSLVGKFEEAGSPDIGAPQTVAKLVEAGQEFHFFDASAPNPAAKCLSWGKIFSVLPVTNAISVPSLP